MSTILSNITDLVSTVPTWVTAFLKLFFTWNISGSTQEITGLSFLGIVCIALPLVGLGIGIIKRLVSIRA